MILALQGIGAPETILNVVYTVLNFEGVRTMRLIDADALLDEVCEDLMDGDVLDRIPPSYIDDAPTVDAVEVVRCKDCGYGGLCGAEIACNHPAYAQNEGVWSYDPEFFCAYGERRPE